MKDIVLPKGMWVKDAVWFLLLLPINVNNSLHRHWLRYIELRKKGGRERREREREMEKERKRERREEAH